MFGIIGRETTHFWDELDVLYDWRRMAMASTMLLLAISHFLELAWEWRGASIIIALLYLTEAAVEASHPMRQESRSQAST